VPTCTKLQENRRRQYSRDTTHYSNADGITDQAKLDQRNRKVAASKGQQTQLAAMSREGVK
jgi:hypothetical protein